MISQKPIVDRLKSVGLRNVEGILEWAGLTEAPRASPAFFVAPEADSAAPNSMGTITVPMYPLWPVIRMRMS